MAGAISPTVVPERSLGCGAACAPFRRRRSTDDGPALAAARTAGGADPWLSDSTHDRHAGIAACRAGVRFFLAEPPPRRDWRHRWARLDPGALSRRGGRSRRRRVDLMPNSQKSAGWTVCASNHAVTAQLILRRIKGRAALTRFVQMEAITRLSPAPSCPLRPTSTYSTTSTPSSKPSAPTSSTQPLAHLPCGNVGVHSAGALKVNHRIAVIPVATQSR